MDSFLKPHTTSCTTKDCWVFSFWFQSLERVNCCRQSEVMLQISFTRRCVLLVVHSCIKETLFNFLYIFNVWELSGKDKLHATLDPFAETLTTTNMASCTSPQWLRIFSTMFAQKIQNMAFKTSKMDQIALEYRYYGFFGRLRVDGRGFLHQKPILKKRSPDFVQSAVRCVGSHYH